MSSIQAIQLPLILGGHSFISQLGNDPAANFDQQCRIVHACLQAGITWIDTTYQPERIALGKILKTTPRSGDVKILAWNFFRDFDAHGELGGPDFFQPHHLQVMLDQLQVQSLQAVVVHWIGDDERANRKQEEVAIRWRNDGHVRELGIWSPPADSEKRYAFMNPYTFVVWPTSIATAGIATKLAWARACHWRNFGTSPFVRGWHLDKLFAAAQAREPAADPTALRQKLAAALLRYALYLPNVDRLIVAMRKADWVLPNVHAVRAGELRPAERAWLCDLQATITA